MCDHTTRAIGLEHGAAHADDHLAWTRRDFLVRSGLAAAGAAVLTGAGPARAATLGAARHPGLLGALRALDTDRVLVLVQLSGGNDGLNTVVPIHDDRYYNARSGLALPASATLRLDDDLGFHPAFAPLMGAWSDGRLAVVEGVGYQDQSLSHFEGIDVWASAREDDGDRGWTALAAESIGGDPATPPSVQVGASYPLLMTGSDGVEGMTLSSPDLLDQIVTSGELFDTSALPDTPVGRQLRFVREVANDANLYVGSMRAAADGVTNAAEYATDGFSKSLAQVARLIKGRLGTRVYLVKLGGFDTHANQLDAHHGAARPAGDGARRVLPGPRRDGRRRARADDDVLGVRPARGPERLGGDRPRDGGPALLARAGRRGRPVRRGRPTWARSTTRATSRSRPTSAASTPACSGAGSGSTRP